MTSAPVPLTALSLPVESFGPIDDLVEMLPHFAPSGVWLREGRGMIGLGVSARTSARGAERFAQLAHWYDAVRAASTTHGPPELEAAPGTGLTAFVTVSYAADSVADSELVIPEIVLGRTADTQWVSLIQEAGDGSRPPNATDVGAALRHYGLTASETYPWRLSLPALDADSAGQSGHELPPAELCAGTHPEEHYLDAVRAGTTAIQQRRVEKIVLARDAVVTAETPLAAGTVLRELARQYHDCWTYFAGSVLGATPEMLVQVRGDQLRARVLAGTVDGEVPFEEARSALLRDAKQRNEHQIAVESLLSHLGPVTSSLSAQDRPEVLVLPNVYHLATDVTGRLSRDEGASDGGAASGGAVSEGGGAGAADDVAAGNGAPGAAAEDASDGPGNRGAGQLSPLFVAERAHPTAAICGTPTATAQHMIAALEELDRGPFSGPVGWIDGAGNADFGIALRGGVLENDATSVRLYAGCGVVTGSEPEAELAETWAKMRPMLSALGLRR